jgi:hypothetical protein
MADRTSFAPETTSPERNERDQSPTKYNKINEAGPYPSAHNGLVASSSAVRTNNEINTGQSPVCGRGVLSPQVSGKCLHGQSGLRASPLTPKIRQSKTAGSFLFVRRGTQSYDEFIAAVPLRPRLSMMLGMINTSDIFSIGENARACTSSGRRVT